MRLIDADEAVKRIAKEQDKATTGIEDVTYYRAIKIIRSSPTIEAEPVKHGRWVNVEKRYFYFHKCSNCEEKSKEYGNYCPNCGARMRGDTDEEP